MRKEGMTLFHAVRQNTSGFTVGNENVPPFNFYCTILPVKAGDKKRKEDFDDPCP